MCCGSRRARSDRGGDGDISAELVQRDLATGRALGQGRPATYSLTASLRLLRDALAERGLLKSRIGLELGFVPAADFPAFAEALPETIFVDCTALVARLRAIKHAREIAMLREAAEFSMAGVSALMARLRPGLDAAEMTAVWREAARAEARRRGRPEPQSDWAYIAVGGDGFAPGVAARPGDLVKIDVGSVIGGYSSDGGRTAVIGNADRAQRAIFDALHAGFDAGLARLKPGAALAEVHRATTRAIHDRGFLTYQRGHFGHGVGASVWSEEWPFIAADSEAIAEPGMMLAFETPYYVAGVGGFIIEDQVLVTERDVEAMGEAPRDLFEAAIDQAATVQAAK